MFENFSTDGHFVHLSRTILAILEKGHKTIILKLATGLEGDLV